MVCVLLYVCECVTVKTYSLVKGGCCNYTKRQIIYLAIEQDFFFETRWHDLFPQPIHALTLLRVQKNSSVLQKNVLKKFLSFKYRCLIHVATLLYRIPCYEWDYTVVCNIVALLIQNSLFN